jgi:hypothetical protein
MIRGKLTLRLDSIAEANGVPHTVTVTLENEGKDLYLFIFHYNFSGVMTQPVVKMDMFKLHDEMQTNWIPYVRNEADLMSKVHTAIIEASSPEGDVYLSPFEGGRVIEFKPKSWKTL